MFRMLFMPYLSEADHITVPSFVLMVETPNPIVMRFPSSNPLNFLCFPKVRQMTNKMVQMQIEILRT